MGMHICIICMKQYHLLTKAFTPDTMPPSGSVLSHCPPEYVAFYRQPAGKEHYRLLEVLASKLKHGVVVDLGTLYGLSALALSSNPRLEVWTYDITNHIPADASIRLIPNISFRLKNGLHAIPDFVERTGLIVLDVDPHDGIQEKQCVDLLVQHGYKGMLVCDDIHLNDAMEAWWNAVELPKRDVTHEGHHSGTGIIYFDGIVELSASPAQNQ